jgi:hypothetical protein
MKKTKTLKTIALLLGLAAMMAPATMNAQINHGLLKNPYKDESHDKASLLQRSGAVDATITGGIQNDNFLEVTPLGSGIAILLAAGLGYVALKKKEDEQ